MFLFSFRSLPCLPFMPFFSPPLSFPNASKLDTLCAAGEVAFETEDPPSPATVFLESKDTGGEDASNPSSSSTSSRPVPHKRRSSMVWAGPESGSPKEIIFNPRESWECTQGGRSVIPPPEPSSRSTSTQLSTIESSENVKNGSGGHPKVESLLTDSLDDSRTTRSGGEHDSSPTGAVHCIPGSASSSECPTRSATNCDISPAPKRKNTTTKPTPAAKSKPPMKPSKTGKSIGRGLSDRVISLHTGSMINSVGFLREQSTTVNHCIKALRETSLIYATKEDILKYIQKRPELEDKITMSLGGNQVDQHISKIALFKGIPAESKNILAAMMKVVPLDVDEVLFAEGDLDPYGNSLFIVTHGNCRAVTYDERGDEIPLREFSAGQFFGEIALLIDIPRTATIVASTKCHFLELTYQAFHRFLALNKSEQLEKNLANVLKLRAAESLRRFQVPLFESIPIEKYMSLAALGSITELVPGTVIFHEGEIGESFHIILHGGVTLFATKDNRDGTVSTLELAHMGAGEYFGEIALLRKKKRLATARVVARTILLSIDKSGFDKFFQEVPEALANFEMKLSRYEVSLLTVCHHRIGRLYFRKYCESEFSSENFDFWQSVIDFKNRHAEHQAMHQNDVRASTERLRESISSLTHFTDTPHHPSQTSYTSGLPEVREQDRDDDEALSATFESGMDMGQGPNPRTTNEMREALRQLTTPISTTNGDRTSTCSSDRSSSVRDGNLFEIIFLNDVAAIVNTHIVESAPKQINIDALTKETIIENFAKNPTIEIFDDAQKEVVRMMKSDTFQRFKRSNLFKEMIAEMDQTEILRTSNSSMDTSTRSSRDSMAMQGMRVPRPHHSVDGGDEDGGDGATGERNHGRLSFLSRVRLEKNTSSNMSSRSLSAAVYRPHPPSLPAK